jgi:hypothetical protein
LFRRRIVGVVVVEYDVGERSNEKIFSHKKKNSLINNNKG